MKEWLLNNGYILKDGVYINYDKAIIVTFNDYDYPFVRSLHGFYTKDYSELSMIIAEHYPIEL